MQDEALTSDALITELLAIFGEEACSVDEARNRDYLTDESLHAAAAKPICVVWPRSTEQVLGLLAVATQAGVRVIARGSGTGLSGAAVATSNSIVCCFSRMNALLDLDIENRACVVQPGISLAELEEALSGTDLFYPVYPGESSASLGGNINTNAGGMRAVRHGVTRNHVLGLEVVLGSGLLLRSGGKYSKSSSGYDLTQLIIGSEGTLGLVTEITLKLSHRLALTSTALIPFASLEAVCAAVPAVDVGVIAPSILEYLDFITMDSLTKAAELELAIDPKIKEQAMAYLVVVLEGLDEADLERRNLALAQAMEELGGLELYLLAPKAGQALIEARERAFYVAKAAGANDIIDAVVPRMAIPSLLTKAGELAAEVGAFMTGCGHAGDGNVHLSVFCPDDQERQQLLTALFAQVIELGGAVSGEHGLGTEKRSYHEALIDPARVALDDQIKAIFDPHGVLRALRPNTEESA